MKEWTQISTIEMFVNSVDANFDIEYNDVKIIIDCNLLNIARGRCSVTLLKRNNKNKDMSRILINADKPIMEATKTLKEANFESIQNQIKLININKNKKIKITLTTDKPLAVDNSGFLQIENETELNIVSIKFNIPYL